MVRHLLLGVLYQKIKVKILAIPQIKMNAITDCQYQSIEYECNIIQQLNTLFLNRIRYLKMSNYFNLYQIGCIQSFESLTCPQSKKNISQKTSDQKDSQHFDETRISDPESYFSQYFGEPSTALKVFADSNFQASFLRQHRIIFQKYIRNYIELFGEYSESALISKQLVNDRSKDISSINLSLFLQNEYKQFTDQQREAFLQIGTYQKLFQFIEYVVNHYHKAISIPLIKMIKIIFECQGHYEFMKSLNEQEILSRASQITNPTLFNQIKLILLKENSIESKELVEKIKKFSLFLANTVLFIANNFLVNPYYQLEEQLIVKEYLNYELMLYDISNMAAEEEQQDYIGSAGRKRIKTQYN